MSTHTQQKTLFQRFFQHKRVIIIGIAILLAGGIYIGLDSLRVRQVVVNGVDSMKGLESYSGSLIPFLSAQRMQDEIEELNPRLGSIRVTKQFPDTLRISARRLQPSIVLQLKDGYLDIAENGVILAKHRKQEQDNLPVITYYQPLYFNNYRIGDTIDYKEVLSSMQLIPFLEDVGSTISTIDIADEDMIVLQTDTFVVRATSLVDSQVQGARFAYTFAEFKRRGKDIQSIDVRFERPVIKLK